MMLTRIARRLSLEHRIGTVAAVLLLAVGISACTTSPPPADTPPPPLPRPDTPPPPPTAAKPQPPAGPDLGRLRPQPRPDGPNNSGTPGDAAATPPPVLMGMPESRIAAILGKPSQEVTETPGKLWVYQGNGCRLSIHLFPDVEQGEFHALDYDADGDRDACLARLAQDNRKRPPQPARRK